LALPDFNAQPKTSTHCGCTACNRLFSDHVEGRINWQEFPTTSTTICGQLTRKENWAPSVEAVVDTPLKILKWASFL
jgi:hypothetical protein